MSGNTITVTTVRLDNRIPKNTHCEICGEDQWFHRTPRIDKKKPSALFPCTWEINRKRAYAHLGEVVIAQVFKNTIEGHQILLTASERSHRISEMRYNDSNEKEKRALVDTLTRYICRSNIGGKLHVRQKLNLLKGRFTEQAQFRDLSDYAILKIFEGQDIHDAFAWMRNEPRSEQDMDDEKEPIDFLPRSHGEVYPPIDPPLPNEGLEEMQSDDSDDDANVDWHESITSF